MINFLPFFFLLSVWHFLNEVKYSLRFIYILANGIYEAYDYDTLSLYVRRLSEEVYNFSMKAECHTNPSQKYEIITLC